MAWIVERKRVAPEGFENTMIAAVDGVDPTRYYLVRWRVDGKTLTSDMILTRKGAEAFRDDVKKTERRTTGALERMTRHAEKVGRPIPHLWEGIGEESLKFATYLSTMIEGDRELRESTRELYLRNIRVHIATTELGATDVRFITPELLTAFWDVDLKDAGKGALRNIQQLLSKGLNRAVKVGLIEVSPLKRTDIKRPSPGRAHEEMPLNVAQLELLADSAKYPRDRLEILVMGYGGLRAGEVAGLRVQDCDFKTCQLKLRQQVVRVTGKGMYVSPLKTKAARRTVTLPCSVTDELKAFIAEEPPAPDGRIFHGARGALRAHTGINHGVQLAAKKAGLDTHAHALRHTAVSLLIDTGANPKSIQQFVGHSNIRETLQTYGHLFDYGGQALADSLERLREDHKGGA
jgi:integrase